MSQKNIDQYTFEYLISDTVLKLYTKAFTCAKEFNILSAFGRHFSKTGMNFHPKLRVLRLKCSCNTSNNTIKLCISLKRKR